MPAAAQGDGALSFGAWLRRSRVLRELSVDHVAAATRLPVRLLHALESDEAQAFPHRYAHLRYADAGHNIGWPNVPTTETRFKHPVSGVEIDHGGTARGTAFASSDSWGHLLRFLTDAFTRPPD